MAGSPLPPHVLAGLVLAIGLGIAAPADAKCGTPEIVVVPGSGTVPPNPVLWLMAPGWNALVSAPPRLDVRSNGVSVPFRMTAGPAAPMLDTFRVEIAGATPGPLDVEILEHQDSGNHRTWSLRVDAAWRAPASNRATIATTRTETKWACSGQFTRDLEFTGDAPAYRVVVADTLAGLDAGTTRQVVVPHDTGQLWSSTGREARANVALGFVNCYGTTFTWGTKPLWLKLFALLPDGSEQPVNGTAIQVVPPSDNAGSRPAGSRHPARIL